MNTAVYATGIVFRSKPLSRNMSAMPRRLESAAPNALTATIVIVESVTNVPRQSSTRTIGFVTSAEN